MPTVPTTRVFDCAVESLQLHLSISASVNLLSAVDV